MTTANYTINLAADKRSTINMGHIESQRRSYVQARNPTVPTDGTLSPNEAIMRADNIEEQKSSVAGSATNVQTAMHMGMSTVRW